MPQVQDYTSAAQAAQAAIDFTRGALANGNANPYFGIPSTQFRAPQHLVEEAVLERRRHPNVALQVPSPDPLAVTLCDAKISMGAKAGNCGEHASVAFAFLYAHGVHTISKVGFPQGQGDHAFVVIGPVDEPNAVICDPWANVFVRMADRAGWKQWIWGTPSPDDSLAVVYATATSPGSEGSFNFITAQQPVYEKMDFSF